MRRISYLRCFGIYFLWISNEYGNNVQKLDFDYRNIYFLDQKLLVMESRSLENLMRSLRSIREWNWWSGKRFLLTTSSSIAARKKRHGEGERLWLKNYSHRDYLERRPQVQESNGQQIHEIRERRERAYRIDIVLQSWLQYIHITSNDEDCQNNIEHDTSQREKTFWDDLDAHDETVEQRDSQNVNPTMMIHEFSKNMRNSF